MEFPREIKGPVDVADAWIERRLRGRELRIAQGRSPQAMLGFARDWPPKIIAR